MAEKKQHNFVAADAQTQAAAEEIKKKKLQQAKPVGNASALRAGAIVCWIVALVCEILALRIITGKMSINLFHMSSNAQIIAFLVIDLALVILGAQFWKKANHIKPASEKNKFLFWLWNNMGVIVCIICFLPFIILVFLNKDIDKKTRTIALAVAACALIIGGVSSYDFNPVSVEQQTAAIEALGEETVFWAPHGKVYHTHDDCQALNQTDTLTYGSVAEAIAAGRTRLCSFCAKKDDISGVVTDEVQ